MIITPGFILAMLSVLMMCFVSGVSGQWSEMMSLWA